MAERTASVDDCSAAQGGFGAAERARARVAAGPVDGRPVGPSASARSRGVRRVSSITAPSAPSHRQPTSAVGSPRAWPVTSSSRYQRLSSGSIESANMWWTQTSSAGQRAQRHEQPRGRGAAAAVA